MHPSNSAPDGKRDRAIPAWRLAAGAFLHFAVPAYAITVPVACLLTAPAGASIADLARIAVPASGWFLAGYAGLGALAVAAAAAIEPALRRRRARREARDPRLAAAASARRVAWAVANGRTLLGDRAGMVLDSIRGPRWDHGDPRCQALSADLAEVVRTSARALKTAPASRCGAIAEAAMAALDRIDTALAGLFAERGRLDEGDALTVARYVELRYRTSDFSGDEP